jgi:hypothetical protein
MPKIDAKSGFELASTAKEPLLARDFSNLKVKCQTETSCALIQSAKNLLFLENFIRVLLRWHFVE